MNTYLNSDIYITEYNEIYSKLLECGVDGQSAHIIADCFATADIFGVTSHGIAVLPSHIDRIKNGGYNLNPLISVIRETASFAVIDGDNAFGPVSAKYCLDYGINKCKSSGVFTVFSRNNNTFGPAFYYSLKAAEQGFIAFVCSNSPAQMAPSGGVDKLFGTNPFTMVIPVPNKDPIIVDMSTSVVAKSKFKEYKKLGKKLPDGWALDKSGNPTNDPDEAINGIVMPMGGFKGYAISMLIDIVAGALSGASYLNKVGRFYSNSANSMNVGFYMTIIDPYQVLGYEYDEIISNYVNTIRQSKHISGNVISIPGDDRIDYKNKMIGRHDNEK